MPPPAFIPADESPRFVRFFSWWARDKMLAKKFFALRLAQGSRQHLTDLANHPGPVVAVINHVSWWDPLIMLTLHRQFWAPRSLRAPMDAAQLQRFAFFRKLGTFGLDPDNPASLDAMAAYLRDYFASAPHPTLWINPQGRFADPREAVEARPGAARVAAGDDRTRCVAVAIEYAFWLDQRPEVLIRVEPVTPQRSNTPGWLRAITDAMRTNAADLARLVIARDPANFDCLVGGDATTINPVYDLWLRLRGKAGALDDRRDRLAASRSINNPAKAAP